jgi:hypothetical protein
MPGRAQQLTNLPKAAAVSGMLRVKLLCGEVEIEVKRNNLTGAFVPSSDLPSEDHERILTSNIQPRALARIEQAWNISGVGAGIPAITPTSGDGA